MSKKRFKDHFPKTRHAWWRFRVAYVQAKESNLQREHWLIQKRLMDLYNSEPIV